MLICNSVNFLIYMFMWFFFFKLTFYHALLEYPGLFKAPYNILAWELHSTDSTTTAKEVRLNATWPDLSEANYVIKILKQEPESLSAAPSFAKNLRWDIQRLAFLCTTSPCCEWGYWHSKIRIKLPWVSAPQHNLAQKCKMFVKLLQKFALLSTLHITHTLISFREMWCLSFTH